MSDKTQEVEDIDAPIELNQSKIARGFSRVGVSKKGLTITIVAATAIVAVIGFGIVSAGPGKKADDKDGGSTDMPGLSQAVSIDSLIKRPEPPKLEEQPQNLQVRGVDDKPIQVPQQNQQQITQQTPAQQHEAWLEKKRYERLQGRILAWDAAVTADLMKGNGSGGGRAMAAQAGAGGDSLARLAAARDAAKADAAAQIAALQNPSLPSSLTAALAGGSGGGGEPAVAAQERNRAFLAEVNAAGYLPEFVKPKLGQHELSAGSIIPAVMLTGINSDLPGVITAQVRKTIYDTFDENVVVVPQGSRIVGRYSSQVAVGQNRVLVAWDELIMPNGNRINLHGMTGADGIGQGGFGDKVNNHFWKLWGNALMVSMLGVGVQLSQPQNDSYNTAPTAGQQATGAAAASLNQAGAKVLEKNLNISPTLTIRPGYAFNIIVNKSVLFPAYR